MGSSALEENWFALKILAYVKQPSYSYRLLSKFSTKALGNKAEELKILSGLTYISFNKVYKTITLNVYSEEFIVKSTAIQSLLHIVQVFCHIIEDLYFFHDL